MSLKSERGFFVVDWVYRLFEGTLWQIGMRWAGLALLGYLAIALIPVYRQANAIHDAVRSVSYLSSFPEQTTAEVMTSLDAAFVQRKISLRPRDVLTVRGRGAHRTIDVAYDASITLEKGDRIASKLIIEFCFDQTTAKQQALVGAACAPDRR